MTDHNHWAYDSVFYHIYPLGFCDAPAHNDFNAGAVPRLEKLYGWLDHLQWLGVNALYLGPLFESTRHGYDTADYYHVDRRLGTRDTLRYLSAALHERGIRLVLDGVFNHTGRDFWAFRDVLANGQNSPYCDWYHGLRFDAQSPYGDPFTYDCWDGHYSLPKLNLHNPAVVEHLLGAVGMWIDEFQIDGLRLDAADVIAPEFLRQLAAYGRERRSDFWLVGEVVHGDYRQWANPDTLDSVTNYECYKGLYSSLEDKNYHEIAYGFNRQFGAGGMYRHLPLYNFVDNHDVNRVASNLSDPAHLYPLYCMLFTMPGVPSIYYGSEWGIQGVRESHTDAALRPALVLEAAGDLPDPHLPDAIRRLARLRHESPALRYGRYRQIMVEHEQFVFARQADGEHLIVVFNAADEPVRLTVPLPDVGDAVLVDVLNGGERFPVRAGQAQIDPLYPRWARVLRVEAA
jgi:cyclomaltodextrinase